MGSIEYIYEHVLMIFFNLKTRFKIRPTRPG